MARIETPRCQVCLSLEEVTRRYRGSNGTVAMDQLGTYHPQLMRRLYVRESSRSYVAKGWICDLNHVLLDPLMNSPDMSHRLTPTYPPKVLCQHDGSLTEVTAAGICNKGTSSSSRDGFMRA